MDRSSSASGTVRFGPFEADLTAGELRQDARKIKLQEKPFQVLAALLVRPGEVVRREELQHRLWPADTFVDFDHGLNIAIAKLREALGDSADGPKWIETLPKRGYRFIGPVNALPDGLPSQVADVATPPAARIHSTNLRVTALALVVVFGATSYFAWNRFRAESGQPPGKIMLAVMPFVNLSGDPEQEYFSDGLTEEMIAQLGGMQPERLGVIARTSAMQYKSTAKLTDQIGRELRVDFLLEGSVRQAGDRVRITAQLIQVKDQTHLWTETYDRPLRDILTLQSDVAQAIARQIQVQLTPQQQARLVRSRPMNPEAYQLYLKGRYFWNKRTAEGLNRALAFFEQAIERQPDYAQAYAGLADCYALLGSMPDAHVPASQAVPRAKATALKALEIDDTLAEARTSLAFVKWQYDWDWPGAEKEFQRALELNPGYATAHHWYAYQLITQGRKERALREIRLAQELDPLSLIINTDLGEILCYAGLYDEAIQQSKKTLELDPNFTLARRVLGWAYSRKGMHAESLAALQKAMAVSGNRADLLMSLAYSQAMAGKTAEAQTVLAQMKRLYARSPDIAFGMAVAYASAGEKDQAFALLDKAFRERSASMVLVGVTPVLDPLRGDPRFADLLRRVGLPL